MPLSIKKRPRKTSKNPDIEAILQLKDKWNLQVSTFIYDLIALKRGLNGRGDSEHQFPRSKVTEKVPDSVATLLNRLTGQFRDISQNGLNLIKKQEELSKKLNEKHDNKIDLNIKKSFYDYQLVAEATNPFTRALFKLKGPFSKQPGRKSLTAILYALLDLRNQVEDMQNAAVSRGKDSFVKLTDHFLEFEKNLKLINSLYSQYLLDIGSEEKDVALDKNYSDSRYNFLRQEFLTANAIQSIPRDFKVRFNSLKQDYDFNKNKINKLDWLNKIEKLYEELKNYCKENFITDKPWNSITELFSFNPKRKDEENIKNSSLLIDDKIQILAHNTLSRTFKRKLKEISNDIFAVTKISIFDRLKEMNEIITDWMNQIEKGSDHSVFKENIDALKRKREEIHNLITVIQNAQGK